MGKNVDEVTCSMSAPMLDVLDITGYTVSCVLLFVLSHLALVLHHTGWIHLFIVPGGHCMAVIMDVTLTAYTSLPLEE
jgi:hypothetical protein